MVSRKCVNPILWLDVVQRADASRGSPTESARATCRREMMLGERPCYEEVQRQWLGRSDLSLGKLDLEELKEPRDGVQGAGLRLSCAGWGHWRAEAATCGGGQ